MLCMGGDEKYLAKEYSENIGLIKVNLNNNVLVWNGEFKRPGSLIEILMKGLCYLSASDCN